MPKLQQLHSAILEIFTHAVSAVDAQRAVEDAVKLDHNALLIGPTRIESPNQIYVVAIGKAAPAMAVGIVSVLGEKITEGLVSGPTFPPAPHSAKWHVFVGGHPFPNQSSLDAAHAALAMLDRANHERAAVIFLISGGGSAMFELPVSKSITLPELRTANELLVSCGATISEINCVRRALSAVKGRKLLRRLTRAQSVTMIISDTNQGDEASVASGPTLDPPVVGPSAIEVINRFELGATLPDSILDAIKRAREEAKTSVHDYYVLAENKTAIDAARQKASSLGFNVQIASDICEQPVEEGCELLLEQLRDAPTPTCLLSGGEFSCPVRGNGRGGRNLETVLRCALLLAKDPAQYHTVVLSAGTDGIDGNSPAAGAIADETTIDRAAAQGLDAEDYLSRSDSYHYFEQLNDLVMTGPTGTNVRDLRVILKSEK